MLSGKRIAFILLLNLTVSAYCGILYVQGHALRQVLLIFVVSAVIVNGVAVLSRRHVAKRNDESSESHSGETAPR